MKKILPLFIALVLFLGGLLGGSAYLKNNLQFNNTVTGYLRNTNVFFNHEFITANLDQNTILVFGSSELGSQVTTPFHPLNTFENNEFQMMLIGAGYFQSLNHAITLGACEKDGLPAQKVVLILSPQWFSPDGVAPDSVPSRFSEKNFIAFLQNKAISLSIRQQVSQRINALLQDTDPVLFTRITKYEDVFLNGTGSLPESISAGIYSNFLNVKSNYESLKNLKSAKLPNRSDSEVLSASIPDWENLLQEAQQYGEKACTNNQFYIYDDYFTTYIEPGLDANKNSCVDLSYAVSKEYEDLKIFLSLCKELDIEPLLVSIPLKGAWCDYCGIKSDERQAYYQNIRDIANEYSVKLADFSTYEYEDYFLSDVMHLGWKGWVRVNESIYNFSKKDI